MDTHDTINLRHALMLFFFFCRVVYVFNGWLAVFPGCDTFVYIHRRFTILRFFMAQASDSNKSPVHESRIMNNTLLTN